MCVLFSPYPDEDDRESGSWDTDTYQHSVLSDILQDHLAVEQEACRSSGGGRRSPVGERSWWKGDGACWELHRCSALTQELDTHFELRFIKYQAHKVDPLHPTRPWTEVQVNVHPLPKDSTIHQNADPNLERACTGQVLRLSSNDSLKTECKW